ncbi:hypothetical protein QJS10_CPA05g00806 [Acorus calamus]|uniref:Mitochondrial fission 1 protein n=2 Tax=Acorus calamus TaxID=4465 RepID=A0AAV9EZR0_ACOCL|nr:hypothetical protein QJS10_CPA05g00806 [Acorus calamus]
MEAKFTRFFESVGSFFTGGDNIPWSDRDIIAVVEGFLIMFEILCQITQISFERWRDVCKSSSVVNMSCGGQGCEREVAENEGASDEMKSENLMRLSWALVHSKHPEDVQRGIAMLEASLNNSKTPLQYRERLYLLAVGHYRSGDYPRSRQLVEQCLEIVPDWRQAQTLKKMIEDRIQKDGVIGIGIAATAVGLVAGGIAAALARKK